MKGKRTLLLINDERTLRSVKKAVACYTGAADGGCSMKDDDVCSNHAADAHCVIDLKGCHGDGLIDFCLAETDADGCNIKNGDV